MPTPDLPVSVRPKVGVSACVAGDRVRYNGAHTASEWLIERLVPHVELVKLCPELAMGLSVPRQAMRLMKAEEGRPRLVTSTSAEDMTEIAESTSARLVGGLPEDLDGYVLMGRSPLCGAERVRVYGSSGVPRLDGVGIFARELARARPLLVTIEAGRLTDSSQARHFVTRLFAATELRRVDPSVAALQDFHARYKFLILAQGRKHLQALGQIAAKASAETFAQDFATYRQAFHHALAAMPRRATMTDALMHLYGFAKTALSSEERAVMLQTIESYRCGQLPQSAATALLRFSLERGPSDYARRQALLSPLSSSITGDFFPW